MGTVTKSGIILPYHQYRKGQIVYADLGDNPPGVESGIRPCMVISNSRSNHGYAPQVTVCPMTTKFKKNPVHVRILPRDVSGYSIKQESELLPEQNRTIAKSAIRRSVGYTNDDSEVRYNMDIAMIREYDLLPAAIRFLSEMNDDHIREISQRLRRETVAAARRGGQILWYNRERYH